MKRRVVGVLFGLAVVVAIVSWGIWRFSGDYIKPGYVGIMYSAQAGKNTKNGLIVERSGLVKIFKPGRHWTPPMHEMYPFPTRPQRALYVQDPSFGDLKEGEAVTVTSQDAARITLDVAVRYHVDPSNIGTVFEKFGKTDIETIESQHIRRALIDAANQVCSGYPGSELIAVSLEDAGTKVTSLLQKVLGPKGIDVLEASFLNSYPDENTQTKINTGVTLLADAELAKINNQKTAIERQTMLIMSRAQAKARNLTATKTAGRTLEMMSLEADEAAIDAWDGNFPQVPTGKGITVVVGAPNVAVQGNQ